MREIEAPEAESNLGRLLDWVEAGEEVTITRDGRTVARLLPPANPIHRETALSAAAAIRAMSTGVTLGELNPRDLVDEGRR